MSTSKVVKTSISRGSETNSQPLEGQQSTASFYNSKAWISCSKGRPLDCLIVDHWTA